MEMDCDTYVDGAPTRDDLTRWVLAVVGGTVERHWITGEDHELLVDENEDARPRLGKA